MTLEKRQNSREKDKTLDLRVLSFSPYTFVFFWGSFVFCTGCKRQNYVPQKKTDLLDLDHDTPHTYGTLKSILGDTTDSNKNKRVRL